MIHNAPFDVAFLDEEFARLGMSSSAAIAAEVVDTLALARDQFPGKRNNLDALCERFGVANAHRTLHGALLDAQLLAEVYLAMTRGQESLTIDIVTPRAGSRRWLRRRGTAAAAARPALRGRARRAPRLPGRARPRRQGERACGWRWPPSQRAGHMPRNLKSAKMGGFAATPVHGASIPDAARTRREDALRRS